MFATAALYQGAELHQIVPDWRVWARWLANLKHVQAECANPTISIPLKRRRRNGNQVLSRTLGHFFAVLVFGDGIIMTPECNA